jgi:hypothetical protein
MYMNKEAYERVKIDVTELKAEDVIITSGSEPVGFNTENQWELPFTP